MHHLHDIEKYKDALFKIRLAITKKTLHLQSQQNITHIITVKEINENTQISKSLPKARIAALRTISSLKKARTKYVTQVMQKKLSTYKHNCSRIISLKKILEVKDKLKTFLKSKKIIHKIAAIQKYADIIDECEQIINTNIPLNLLDNNDKLIAEQEIFTTEFASLSILKNITQHETESILLLYQEILGSEANKAKYDMAKHFLKANILISNHTPDYRKIYNNKTYITTIEFFDLLKNNCSLELAILITIYNKCLHIISMFNEEIVLTKEDLISQYIV